MESEMKKIQHQLKVLERRKKSVNVFDEARNDLAYKRHRNELRNVKKKIDNNSPLYSASKFFPQMKLINAQHQLERRLKMNESLINHINFIHRAKGKVDCYNPIAGIRKSNLQARILNQEKIDKDNKNISRNLKNVEPTIISKAKILREDWEMIYRRAVLLNTKYPIAINSLRTFNCDLFLADPPTETELKKSKKVFFSFHLANHGEIGRIVVMLYSKHEPEVVNMFIQRCVAKNAGYQGCKIFKIIKDLLMEISDPVDDDVKPNSLFPNSFVKVDHRYCGNLSILRNDDGSVSSKFCITFKKLSILNDKQIVIGRVVKGIDVLNAINCYGSKFGLPKKTIYIKSCGMIE